MKKLLSVILAIAIMMTLSISAFAEDNTVTTETNANTNVSMNVGTAFTVTIPSEVTIDPTAKTGSATISVDDENLLLPAGKEIRVTLATCAFQLTYEDDTIAYTVNTKSTTQEVGVVATFDAETTQDATVNFAVTGEPALAGEYTDTITFGVAVANAV